MRHEAIVSAATHSSKSAREESNSRRLGQRRTPRKTWHGSTSSCWETSSNTPGNAGRLRRHVELPDHRLRIVRRDDDYLAASPRCYEGENEDRTLRLKLYCEFPTA